MKTIKTKKEYNLKNESYNVTPELNFKRVLEKNNLNPMITLEKNNDKFGTDLKVFKTTIINNNHFTNHVGFIELEKTPNWVGEFPYPYYSFLRRKIDIFCRTTNNFTNKMKSDGLRTIYIKHSKNYNDCFFQSVLNIKEISDVYYDPRVSQNRNNQYYRIKVKPINKKQISLFNLEQDNPKSVKTGVANCVEFINNFF